MEKPGKRFFRLKGELEILILPKNANKENCIRILITLY